MNDYKKEIEIALELVGDMRFDERAYLTLPTKAVEIVTQKIAQEYEHCLFLYELYAVKSYSTKIIVYWIEKNWKHNQPLPEEFNMNCLNCSATQ